jgi:hypothetical protein
MLELVLTLPMSSSRDQSHRHTHLSALVESKRSEDFFSIALELCVASQKTCFSVKLIDVGIHPGRGFLKLGNACSIT